MNVVAPNPVRLTVCLFALDPVGTCQKQFAAFANKVLNNCVYNILN